MELELKICKFCWSIQEPEMAWTDYSQEVTHSIIACYDYVKLGICPECEEKYG